MSAVPIQQRITLRQRVTQLEQTVRDFLGLDSWEDELIGPRELIQRARRLVYPGKRFDGAHVVDVTTADHESRTHWAAMRPRYLTDGSITEDQVTGLQWAARCGAERMSHADALAYCKQLRLGGHDDWRPPTIQELLGIVDYGRSEPAIDTLAFPDTPASWFWTGTPVAGVSGASWSVSFSLGDGYWFSHYFHGFVRAVRGPVARAGQ